MDSCLLLLKRDGMAEWRMGDRYGSGALEDMPTHPGNHTLIVMVPGEDVLLADAKVPSRRAGDTERALPFALEEWLIDAPADQHFAWVLDESRLHAAVVSHRRMQHWSNRMLAAGLEPDVLIPDVLGLPWNAGEWSLVLWQERALLRCGKSAGMVCSRANIDTALVSILDRSKEAQRPDRIRVWCETETVPFDTPIPVEIESLPHALIEVLSTDDASLNLLRGQYSSSRGLRRKVVQTARWAAGMAAVWLLSIIALQLVHYFLLAHQKDRLQAQIEQVFHQALPNEHRIVDARVQMQQALDRERNQAENAHDLLSLLADASGPLAKSRDMHIEHLNYRDGRLDIILTASRASDFDALASVLKSKHLDVHVRNLDANGSTATGHVEIGRSGS